MAAPATMTLLHIRSQLVSILCQQDTITAADFGQIKVTKDVADHKDALIRAALAELVSMGMLRDAGTPESGLWILSSPLNAGGQDLHLSMQVANGVAECINTFLDAREMDGDRVDPLNIHEGHVVMLLEILGDVLTTDPDDPDREGSGS